MTNQPLKTSRSKKAPPAFLTEYSAICKWLNKYCIITGTATITKEGRVSVTGDVRFNMRGEKLKRFAVQFERVEGNLQLT